MNHFKSIYSKKWQGCISLHFDNISLIPMTLFPTHFTLAIRKNAIMSQSSFPNLRLFEKSWGGNNISWKFLGHLTPISLSLPKNFQSRWLFSPLIFLQLYDRGPKKFSLCLNSKCTREKREGKRGKTQEWERNPLSWLGVLSHHCFCPSHPPFSLSYI